VTGPFYRELPSGRIEHRAEPLVLVLALLAVPALLLEQGRSDWVRDVAMALSTLIWIGFALELGFVLTVSRHRLRTLKAHWLEASIVVVAFPVLPAPLQGSLALRALRFVRLGLIGARIVLGAPRVFRPSTLPYIALLVVLLVVLSGAMMSELGEEEVGSVGDGIWWALVTITTVGYGDITPDSPGARVLAGFVMGVGIGFYALLTATVAASFVGREARAEEQELRADMREISERLERIERSLDRADGGGS
jgi:voltage-gated potassium channel